MLNGRFIKKSSFAITLCGLFGLPVLLSINILRNAYVIKIVNKKRRCDITSPLLNYRSKSG
jgi:hypothetical protein